MNAAPAIAPTGAAITLSDFQVHGEWHGSVESVALTPDDESLVYSHRRRLSDLYLVEGLK